MSVAVPPNVPLRLARLHEKCGGNMRRLERLLAERVRAVNYYYIQRLLVNGEEPTNPTVRAALFLPRSTRKPAASRRRRGAFHEDLRDFQIHLRKDNEHE